MRLLVVTQVVDSKHSILGFFHGWITEFSQYFETLTVVCLEEGVHNLPTNVRVVSLGKKGDDLTGFIDRIRYGFQFFSLVWKLRGKYDAVFVHMNQEYVLLAGWYWRLRGTPVYLWRNHYAGTILTNLAAVFCTKIFCTSRYSYTARFKKVVIMPAGSDIDQVQDNNIARVPRSILSLGRITPSKNIHVIVEALGLLHSQGIDFTATVQGKTALEDVAYLEGLQTKVQQLGIGQKVTFNAAVSESETHDIYRAHAIFVNASPSGMLDKTIFSASAHNCLVLASSKDFATEADPRCVFEEGSAESLSKILTVFLSMSAEEIMLISNKLAAFAERHSLVELGRRLRQEIV